VRRQAAGDVVPAKLFGDVPRQGSEFVESSLLACPPADIGQCRRFVADVGLGVVGVNAGLDDALGDAIQLRAQHLVELFEFRPQRVVEEPPRDTAALRNR
jgi:hypothetical protein